MKEVIIENPYCIEPIEGYTPQLGQLIKMMNYARITTIESVYGLTNEQIDFQFSANSNSIGALLAHIAAVEECFLIGTTENRSLTEEEFLPLKPAFELGKSARQNIKGNCLEYYINNLNAARKKTLVKFSELDDNWLFESFPDFKNNKCNNYFEWFHVFEDEINHRGQIRLIRKMQKA